MGAVTSADLAVRFDYTFPYAAKRLSILKSQGLVYDIGKNPTVNCGYWALTQKGADRLYYLCHKKMNILTDREKREQDNEWINLKAREQGKPFLPQKLGRFEDNKMKRIKKGEKFGVTFYEANEALKFRKGLGS